jgi:PncC family amidohydrolase
VLETVVRRLRGTWFKRLNPIRLEHPVAGRYEALEALDERLFLPEVLKDDRAMSRFGGDIPDLAHQFGKALAARGLRLVTAESCTAGLLAACVAEAPGSSAVLEGSVVSYAASMKASALGVPEGVIEERTVYSAEVARAMALGALERAPGAGLALAVTGVGGPGPDQGKPAGLVYVAAALRDSEPVVEAFRFGGRPREVLAAAVRAALGMGIAAVGGKAG